MSTTTSQETTTDNLAVFTEILHTGSVSEVRAKLGELVPAEIAHIIESLPPEERGSVWELVDDTNQGEVLLHVNDDVRRNLIREMDQYCPSPRPVNPEVLWRN